MPAPLLLDEQSSGKQDPARGMCQARVNNCARAQMRGDDEESVVGEVLMPP